MQARMRRSLTSFFLGRSSAEPTDTPRPSPVKASDALVAADGACPAGRSDSLPVLDGAPLRFPSIHRGPAMVSPSVMQHPLQSPYRQVVQQWQGALAACSAEQMARFCVLRALVPLVRQTHELLIQGAPLDDVRPWISRIEAELACPLHHGLIEQAGALACGHVFEASWLAAHLAPPQDDGTSYCPTCRQEASMVEAPVALGHILRALRSFYEQVGHAVEVLEEPPEIGRRETDSDGEDALAQLFTSEDLAALDLASDDNMVEGANLPPLLQAALSGSGEFIENILLAEGDTDLNVQGPNGLTALHIACNRTCMEVAQVLLNNGANPNVQNEDDCTPLHFAAWRNSTSLIALLLEHGADIDGSRPSPLSEAVGMGHVAAARALLAARASVARPDTRDGGLLHEAVVSQDPEMVRLLLEAGCDVLDDPEVVTPLILAVGDGLEEIVDILLAAYVQRGAEMRESLARPLLDAAQLGSYTLVTKLIAAGADTNARSVGDGAGPLHLAIANGAASDVIAALLQGGARCDQPNGAGQTPRDVAVAYARSEVLALLQAR